MSYPDNVEAMLSVASHWGFEGEIPKETQEKLLNLGPKRSVPAIIDLLDTPNIMSLIFMDRFFTVHAFEALQELTKKTQDPDPLVKSRAFHFLGRLKDSRTLKYCFEALNNPSWRVRSSAMRALGDLGKKASCCFNAHERGT